tara:strand:- start:1881 stop:3656 length:1776 start_codon:yes stop_codon:yes gene_type:complete
MRLVFDIETDGLLDTVSKVHCIVARNIDDDKEYVFVGNDCREGVKFLASADTLIGHNIIAFDIPVLQKLYPDVELTTVNWVDTLVLTRLIWPDRRDRDYKLFRSGKLPPKQIGSHSLKAWGYRIGEYKGEFGETTDWAEFSDDMLKYCQQDVVVNLKLYLKIEAMDYSQDAIDLEHSIHKILVQQEHDGFPFDERAAEKLFVVLNERRLEIERELMNSQPPWIEETEFIPKVNNKTRGYEKGVPFIKTKEIPFNPNSREHIARMLIEKYNWQPTLFTETGLARVDEKVLSGLDYPEAKLLNESLMLQKRLGQLAEGANAWLKLSKNGVIHGRVNHMGAVTSRCTHSNPNTGQIPSVSAPFGSECRSLFHAPTNYMVMGCDVSGLELRCLAHFMAIYDDGEYGDILLNGDIHTANQNAAGLPSRDMAKTFIYGFLYGAGDEKVGSIVGKGKKEGARLKREFLKKTPALDKLRKAVRQSALRGYLIGLDKRKMPVRSEHAALNTLLQGCGAIICKRWVVEFHKLLKEHGYKQQKDYWQAAFVHDEVQVIVREEIGDDIGRLCIEAIKRAGNYYDFRIPLDGEYKLGRNWAETH